MAESAKPKSRVTTVKTEKVKTVAKKSRSEKATKSQKTANTSTSVRKRKLPNRTKKKIDRTIKRSSKLPASWKIMADSLKHLWRHRKLFLGILAVYGLLNIIFVKGIANNFQITNIRSALDSLGASNTWSTSLALFGILVGSGTSTSGESGSVYQTFLLIIASLALIWALRATYAKEIKVRVRDSFYKGMYPFVPVVLVLIMVMLQLLPMLIGTSLYNVVRNGGLAVHWYEKTGWLLLLFACIGSSFYMVSSSVFALYIVTLPNMTPLRAIRAARKMVKFRRWTIVRKVVFLPFSLIIVSGILLIPLIFVLPVAADLIYTVEAILALGVIHSYGYRLYRELL